MHMRVTDVVVSGASLRVADLTRRRPATVRGFVEDVASEALLEGVDIQILNSAGALALTVQTDATGAYEATGLAPGAYRVVCRAPRGYAAATSEVAVQLGPGQALEVDFDLAPSGAVAGRVVDEDTGEPLPGVNVLLLDSVGRVVRRATSGGDGSYEFRQLPEDKYTVALEDG